jgi:hypothetical protein
MFYSKVASVFLAFFALAGQIQSRCPYEAKLTPFIADVEHQTYRILQNSQSLDRSEQGKYYFDSRGRLRYELGSKVMISDVVQNITWLLDTDTKVAKKYDYNKLRGARPAPAHGRGAEPSFTHAPDSTTINGSNQQPGLMNSNDVHRKALGSRIIEGIICEGQEVASVIPANSKLGNKKPVTIKLETWYSKGLPMPVLTINENPLYGRSVMKLKNIKTGSEPKENLFRVPEGYRIVE